MRVAVIGAGPAGLTAAHEVQSTRAAEVDVYEAGSRVGGLCASLDLWGHRVDHGPHRFFSSDRRVNEFWLSMARSDYRMVNRLTRIFYQNQFFQYPLRPISALRTLGLAETVRCVGSFVRDRARAPASESVTYEEWIVSRFGRRLYEIFFKSYSEKLWGLPCSQIDPDFAAQRIRQLSLSEIIKEAFSIRGGEHRSLLDSFAYPNQGTGMIYERVADQVRERGGRIWLETPVERVIFRGDRVPALVVKGETGERRYDHVISTMPLTTLARFLPNPSPSLLQAIASLRYRNTILVYLHVDGSSLFPDNWIYLHSPELRLGRVTNFRNWGPVVNADKPTTVLCLEFWCNREDALWSETDEALKARARGEMQSTGLLTVSGKTAGILDAHVVRIPRSYPVYETGYQKSVDVIIDSLRRVEGVTAIGRYGSFKYNNQDHSILMGLLAADNISRGKSHDLWAVNTDYEAYQERTQIHETGLRAL